MFFVVSKLFWFFADPFSFILLLGLLGLALSFGRMARFGRALRTACVLLLVIVCFLPIGTLLVRPLEDRFPQPPADLPAPTGIIVLGGAINQEMTLARKQPTFLQFAERLTAGVILARRYPTARLIYSGGNGGLNPDGTSEATGAHELWLALGVPEAQMSFEPKSRNTWENAVYTRALVHPRPDQTWLLVTSAWHMPRAMGIFRRAGFKVIAYPVDYHTFGNSRDFLHPPLGLDQVAMLEYAVHEWIGLVVYHLTGKTDAWFPAP
ncbi:MAG: YdcF family protein [Methylovirgula sp.]